jgi:ribose transport system substrate-binding protein
MSLSVLDQSCGQELEAESQKAKQNADSGAIQRKQEAMRAIPKIVLATCMLLGSGALADEFHGFDPANFDGQALPAEQLKAMVTDAKQVSPPHAGTGYVIGFANLQRDISFGVLVEQGIKANADAAGVELLVADNRLDGATALANAQSFVRRHVDYVIEFQTDVNFGPAVMRVFDGANTKVTAIDIPMPGATFFGVNNPRSGFMTGSYLAQAATHAFGEQRVHSGYLVIGVLPQSGAVPMMRTDGELHGFIDTVKDFPSDHIIQIDTKNTLQESFAQMNNVLGRIPGDVPIMVTAINDQSVIGMLRAVRGAGRADVIGVGMGADELEALATDDKLVAATGSFPERYGNSLIPMALMALAGKPLPPAVFVHHQMVTKANICHFSSKYPCKGQEVFEYAFPQSAFEAYLANLHERPELKGYAALIPSN